MFDEYKCIDWIDRELKEIIENEIVYNEDIDSILYDDDWELFKASEFTGGDTDGKDESDRCKKQLLHVEDGEGAV